MLLLIAIAFLLKRYGIQAIPLPAPSPTSASFEAPIFARDNPSDGCHSRTVLDILWSCLATMFACTWVSVHPNVPFRGEGKWTILRRRIFLMFFSILAPEFMIMWAFKQWRGAVMIREAVNAALIDAYPDPHDVRRRLWTTTHGHFLQMGAFRLHCTAIENFYSKGSKDSGFRRAEFLAALSPYSSLDTDLSFVLELNAREDRLTGALSDDEQKQLFPIYLRTRNPIHPKVHYRHETRVGYWTNKLSLEDSEHLDSSDFIWEGVLTIESLKRILSENLIHLPTITEDEINDKSKGDALSKGIALLQLTWFIVQIIIRAAQGLAITELELTTAALAGLNSVMYIFWWSKPRDVRFPVVIRTKGVEALLAKRTEGVEVAWSFSDQEFDVRKHLWASMTTCIKALYDFAPGYFVVPLPFQLISILLKSLETAKTFPPRLSLLFSRVRSLLSRTRKPIASENEGEMLLAVDDGSSPRKLGNRTKGYVYALILGARSARKSTFVPFFCLLYIIDVVLFIPISQILGSDGKVSISGGLFDEVGGLDVDTEEKILSMIFYSEDTGARPLLGTSSIAGALFGAVHCLAWHFSFPSHAEQILWRTASLGIVGSCVVTFQTVLCYRGDAKGIGFVWTSLGILLCGLASFIYPAARITLLVLAITSLRSLPSSAFDTVDWIEFVPHI